MKAHCRIQTALMWVALNQGLGAASPLTAELSALVEKTRPAMVVLVAVDRQGNQKSYGTGFFVSGNGMLVTARHVAQAQDRLLAITQDGEKRAVSGFVGENADFDLSVLQVEGYASPHLRLAREVAPATNEWVALVSAQDRVAPACSTGVVSEVVEFAGLFAAISTTVPVRPGQSGSPLLNAAGEVLGVVPYISFEQSATASPVSAVRRILEKTGSSPAVGFSRRPRALPETPLIFDGDFRACGEAMQRKDWKEAESRIKSAVKRYPESPLAFTLLGSILVQRGAFRQAQPVVEKAMRLSPESGLPRLLRGACLLGRERVLEGLAEVRKSIATGLPGQGTLGSAWRLIAIGESRLGHADEAEEAVERLESLDAQEGAELRQQLGILKPPK